jgi:ATP-dependent helicase HrpB
MQTDLPINDVLEDLRTALGERDAVVLEAPPGAGKTTLVPLALLAEDWLHGQKIVMLEPRRMAARAAAERMASSLGEKAGQTVGYRVRLETRVSAATRIEVITEGILTRMLQSDPSLDGIGLLIFDEFHERSLDSDLGLALALQGRELFRESKPLKILAMSATLDGSAVATLLGDAPVISSQGKQYPVEIHFGKPYQPKQDIVDPVVNLVVSLMDKPETGSVLVFLPGQAEIRRAAAGIMSNSGSERCGDPSSDVMLNSGSEGLVIIAPLYGGLSLEEQRRAIEPAAQGQRKIVLATNIAETSLTIEGITTVVDSGLAREPVYDPGTGMTRLRTARISQSSSIQRAGRAGRLAPGQCYRLWSEAQQQQLAPQSSAEILQADLTPLALQLLAWGVDDPKELRWLDVPPVGPWLQALELLQEFGAIEPGKAGHWHMTADGEHMASLPVHPRLAHMLLCGARWGAVDLACELAAQLSERGGRSRQQAQQYRRLCRALPSAEPSARASNVEEGELLATAYPDRIGKRRQARGNTYQLSNGRSAALSPSDPLCNQEWLVVADMGGRVGTAEDRIYQAASLSPRAFEDALASLVTEVDVAEWDEKAGRFIAERRRCVGALVLSRDRIENVSAETRLPALLKLVRRRGLQVLGRDKDLRQWQARVCLLHQQLGVPWPNLSDDALLQDLESWLAPYLDGVTSLAGLGKLDLKKILQGLLPWPLPGELDALAPERFQVPSGSRVRIDYCESPPVLAVKLQEMFGAQSTPTVAQGRVALMVHLLSPAQRPLQITQDLASFWRNGYDSVKKEMKGRYPRHPWPDDPLKALPTGKTSRRLQRP